MPILPRPPQLVILDCDGVLVNSEPIFNRVLHKFLLSVGAQLSFDACCQQFTGKSKSDVEHYLTAQGLKIPDNWSDRFYDTALTALHHQVEPIPGARTAVTQVLAAGIPCCVASNGLMKKMQVTLGRTGMVHLFAGNMFSAYDIGASKPAPDVFLHAARANHVQPENCVVIEDSPSGFEAAERAAMPCFAYLPDHAQHLEDLHGAHPFSDMATLPAMIGL